MPALRIRGASFMLALATCLSSTAAPPKLTAEDPRFALVVHGQCTQAVVLKPVDLSKCGPQAGQVEYLDGRRMFAFKLGDTDVFFYSPSNAVEVGTVPGAERVVITHIRLLQAGKETLLADAQGQCEVAPPKSAAGPIWHCAARGLKDGERLDIAFRHNGKVSIDFSDNFPRGGHMDPPLVMAAPADLVAALWKSGQSIRSRQILIACRRQAAAMTSVSLLYQCLAFNAAEDYLAHQKDPRSDATPPVLPNEMREDYVGRLRAMLKARGAPGEFGEEDVAQLSSTFGAIHAGAVWRVREAYGYQPPAN